MVNKIVIVFFLLTFSPFSFFLKKEQNLNIIFIGDSITYGTTLMHPESEAPPVYACAYLRKQPGIGKVQFSNQGASGCTTVDFLPATGTVFKEVEKSAGIFYEDKQATLIFSIMLGTNDSAVKGPKGSPVSPKNYWLNLTAIINKLLHDYPGCKIIINRPVWYSPNTYNSSEYLQAGLTRLQSYFPEINALVNTYAISYPRQVFAGDSNAFGYFKNHLTYYTPQPGNQGIFYLHPNKEGAFNLGGFWGKAIYRVL